MKSFLSDKSVWAAAAGMVGVGAMKPPETMGEAIMYAVAAIAYFLTRAFGGGDTGGAAQ